MNGVHLLQDVTTVFFIYILIAVGSLKYRTFLSTQNIEEEQHVHIFSLFYCFPQKHDSQQGKCNFSSRGSGLLHKETVRSDV